MSIFKETRELRNRISRGTLLFDGGMGTYYSELKHTAGAGCELACLSQPELIGQIHREYLAAGCQAIKTNTFSANLSTFHGDEELVEAVIQKAWELAKYAVTEHIQQQGVTKEKGQDEILVFADIGPAGGEFSESKEAEYRQVIDCFLKAGAQNFIFETLASEEGLVEALSYLRERCPQAGIITTFAAQPDGYTREGIYVGKLLRDLWNTGLVDAVGLNCVCGARHMSELLEKLQLQGIPLVVMPNAGYPVVINNRTFYEGDPIYFAKQISYMVELGAVILGGCCGTTPVHIAQIRESLLEQKGEQGEASDQVQKNTELKTQKTAGKSTEKLTAGDLEQNIDNTQEILQSESRFWEKLQQGEHVLAVELDSPADTSLEKFLSGARQLQRIGTDIVTIADCPIARARMDSSLLACKLQRELGIEALPHMTCRDRNLNATKALLLGLYAEGIRNILFITGDPIPTAERDEVKSVYQFNSRKMAGFAASLGETVLPSPFHCFGALDVNARNFEVQIKLAKDKIRQGMKGFLTQPVLTAQALENLKMARKELDAYILGGIIPVVSERNALYMESEINGIRVAKEIIELYKDKDREQSEALAVAISAKIAEEMKPYVNGYYLMTPFQRTGLIAKIVADMKEKKLL